MFRVYSLVREKPLPTSAAEHLAERVLEVSSLKDILWLREARFAL